MTTSGKKNTVHIFMAIDETYSMHPVRKQVREGFDEYITTLASDETTDYLVWAYFFSVPVWSDALGGGRTNERSVRALVEGVTPNRVPRLSGEQSAYRPFGNTNLFDALDHVLNVATQKVATAKKPLGRKRVIFVSWTDGEENASSKYTLYNGGNEHIRGMIEARLANGNWTCVYMGADQNAWAKAQHLGYARGSTISYDSTHTAEAYPLVAAATMRSAHSVGAASTEFFEGINTEGIAIVPDKE